MVVRPPAEARRNPSATPTASSISLQNEASRPQALSIWASKGADGCRSGHRRELIPTTGMGQRLAKRRPWFDHRSASIVFCGHWLDRGQRCRLRMGLRECTGPLGRGKRTNNRLHSYRDRMPALRGAGHQSNSRWRQQLDFHPGRRPGLAQGETASYIAQISGGRKPQIAPSLR